MTRFTETTANTKTNNNNYKTVGFGVNLNIGGEKPEYVGMFINVAKESVMDQLILQDDGSYDLQLLGKLLIEIGKKGEIYQTGLEKDTPTDKQAVLSALGIEI